MSMHLNQPRKAPHARHDLLKSPALTLNGARNSAPAAGATGCRCVSIAT